jgi:hypothetical protein
MNRLSAFWSRSANKLAAWKERLLDCPHHHIVFTVPHELIPLWRYNKREFADTLLPRPRC